MFFFKKYKTMIAIVLCLITSLVMVSYYLKYGTEKSFIRRIVLEAVAPVQQVAVVSIGSVKDAWLRYMMLVGLEEENRNLKRQIDELNAVIVSSRECFHEAERLKKLLSITASSKDSFIAARVIGRDQAALSRTVLIDKGLSDGLKKGMPVISPPGLIGRLVDVSWTVSRVLLFHDENSHVDAIVQRSRTQGIINGAGSGGMILKYISKTQDVQEDDIVVSSGMSGVFPKGWLVGKVIQVDRQDAGLFLKIKVAPFVDFSKLEEVLILTSEQTD
jgi:rod shape-determining protein MreC